MNEVMRIYEGSDGAATKALYADLERLSADGKIAVNLLRAQKCSDRAKKYRGGIRGKGSFRSMAYDRKNWSLGELCKALDGSQRRWGWKRDPKIAFHSWVLYVDLPTGQVSFHSAQRLSGPDYPGEWDGVPRVSATRIIIWCQHLLDAARDGGGPVQCEGAAELPAEGRGIRAGERIAVAEHATKNLFEGVGGMVGGSIGNDAEQLDLLRSEIGHEDSIPEGK